MRAFIKWYFRISCFITIVFVVFCIQDIISFKTTGKFCLMPSLNTVEYTTIEEAWNYIETLPAWGETILFQNLCYYIYNLGLFNLIFSFIAWISKLQVKKRLFLFTIIISCIIIGLYFYYRLFIAGCVSEPYLRKVIL